MTARRTTRRHRGEVRAGGAAGAPLGPLGPRVVVMGRCTPSSLPQGNARLHTGVRPTRLPHRNHPLHPTWYSGSISKYVSSSCSKVGRSGWESLQGGGAWLDEVREGRGRRGPKFGRPGA